MHNKKKRNDYKRKININYQHYVSFLLTMIRIHKISLRDLKVMKYSRQKVACGVSLKVLRPISTLMSFTKGRKHNSTYFHWL